MQDDRDDSVTVTKIPASAYDRPNEWLRRGKRADV